MTYTYKGRRMRNPRAANFVWKCSNGKYLYWFHNHGGKDYEDRNPVWVCCGVEKNTPEGLMIEWSEPEILLYGDDTFVRYSYPDLIEDNGDIFVTETDKYMARSHKIPPKFLKNLFNYDKVQSIAQEGLILDITRVGKNPVNAAMPKLPKFSLRNLNAYDYSKFDTKSGVSLDLCVNLTSLRPGQNLLDSRTACGKGLCVTTGEQADIQITLNDGVSESCWRSEPQVLRDAHLHHISIIIDGGPKIISFIVDGKFCDGGDKRQFGWGRFSSELRQINGSEELIIGKDVDGSVTAVKVYNRAIMATEAVGNFRATLKNM